MKKLLLTLILIVTPSLHSMDGLNKLGTTDDSSSQQVIDRADHDQQVKALQTQLQETETALNAEKLRQAKVITCAHRKWDLKDAAAPLVYGMLVGGKTAYDVYTLLHTPEVPEWLDITNLTLDGAMLTFCVGKTSWHLLKACCRKAKIE